ncbi:MAG: GTPase ObgE [Verrucomicrobiota bacterium]|nr:GTPase ObgE [Verrucomicrobiota bacterium]
MPRLFCWSRNYKAMFVDQVKVYAQAGHGGRGCVSFRREAYVPKGGPDGGNGGRGGNVILEASHDLNNLIAQFYVPRLIAKNGNHGEGKKKSGRSGKDLIVKVPCGTVVWKLPDPEPEPEDPEAEMVHSPEGEEAMMIDFDSVQDETKDSALEESQGPQPGISIGEEAVMVVDLTEHGQTHTLCAAGRGGLGNHNFATSRHQAPRHAQPGEPGEEGHYHLELRLVADIGLVGYPNAGKSTLLDVISQARPKIAAYPFTTLHPQIGVVEMDGWERYTVCDIPGIIEGAHNNVGLGHAFLRHIRRCRTLCIILDMAGIDDREPWEDYEKILYELKQYDEEMLAKPHLVAANKMDEEAAEPNLAEFQKRFPNVEVMEIMAALDEGVPELKERFRKAAKV